jgi:hypothetical protein
MNVEDLVTSGLGSPFGIALDVAGGKMYWTDWVTHKIQRADLDGMNVEDLVTSGLSNPRFIALDIRVVRRVVPTLTEWGMIIFPILLAGTALIVMHRRRRAGWLRLGELTQTGRVQFLPRSENLRLPP